MSSVDFLIELASSDVQAVARLLAAASAPPRPHELRGYEAARQAFENAGATPVRHSAGLPLRRLIGVKLAAVAGALTVTGVAVAAEADVLPSPVQRAAHQVLGGVGVPDPDPASRAAGVCVSVCVRICVASGSGSGAVPGLSSSSSARPATPRPTGRAPDGTTADRGGPVPGTPTGTGNASTTGSSSAADSEALALCRVYVAPQRGQWRPAHRTRPETPRDLGRR